MTSTTAHRPTAVRTTVLPVAPSTGRGRRAGNVALWALQVVTAAVFVVAALPKVMADPQAVAGFAAIGMGRPGMYVIGVLELAGAVALLVPLLSGLAGLAFVGLMTGAVVATAATDGPDMVALPAAILVLAAVIAWGRRRRTADLVAVVRRLARR